MAPPVAAKRVLASKTDATFPVSGVTRRQSALRRVGAGAHQFQLVREPSNPFDPCAVAVYARGVQIGYISATMCKRYGEVISRFEAAGFELWVHGLIKPSVADGAFVAEIDCPYPDEIEMP